ncbi:SDR family oxidoreductase [Candidatus Saccharibacteria bacterium]|nr:SDR family oxidoreductase [Candidatus Saccharibacteria bacterium]
MFNLSGRVAVVTGASSGLGRQMATALARQGADLVILARRFERLEALKKELEEKFGGEKKCECKCKNCTCRKSGMRILPIQCDVTKTEDIEAAAKKVEKEFGKVDILLNCAGSSKDKGVVEMTDEEWDFTIATDETSVFKMTRAFAKIMQKNHYGRIINIASMYGLVGNTEIHTVAYHASKGAVVNFTRAVAAELALDGITCNAICPGYFETELTKAVLDTPTFQEFAKTHVPMQRYGKPGELDAAVVFLASEEASYVNGLIMPVDGGYTAI